MWGMKHFITFEGIDGSGKTTVMHLVYQELLKKGVKVQVTCEPTDTWMGDCVKKCIKNDVDPFVTAFTFIADRFLHVKEIKKWLDQGYLVLCDRYAESTYAYQGAQLRDHLEDPIHWLQDLSKDHILIPDRTFLFDIDPDIAMNRIKHRDELISFEKASFLTKVQKNYLELAVSDHFQILDATQSIETLTHICVEDILSSECC